MISGIDLSQTINYTLKNDTENPTIWKLGILPSYLLGRLSAAASSDDQITIAYRTLQLSIKGWENFDIPYETQEEEIFGKIMQVVPISILERIPLNVITELSTKVLEINKLTPVERKN
jgi:hypothetical protein